MTAWEMTPKTRKLALDTRRSIRDRLAAFVGRHYPSRRHMETDVEIAHSSAASWFNSDPSTPDSVSLVKLAERKHLNLNWLLLGEGPELRGVDAGTDVWRTLRQTLIAEAISHGATREEADSAIPGEADLFHGHVAFSLECWQDFQDGKPQRLRGSRR
jgi:hypothetical protein